MERVYRPLEILSEEEVSCILSNGNIQEIITLPLSIGQNHSKWKFAKIYV